MTYNPTWGAGGGGGVTDGDKGDVVVSGGGVTWTLDTAVATTAGRALLDDASAADQRTTLGLGTAAVENVGAFAAASHGHAQSDITGLVSALASKADTSHTHDASAIASGTFANARVAASNVTQHQAALSINTSQLVGYVPLSIVRTLSNQTTGLGTTYADITDLSFNLAANTAYHFHFYIIASADATTTGIDVAVNGPGTSRLEYTQIFWTSTTATAFRFANTYDANTNSTGSNGTARRMFEVYGYIEVSSVGGTLSARIKREAVGSGPTVFAGSHGLLYRF